MDIGKNIKRIRIKKGLTQLQAAKLCGMLDPQYRRYENGKSNPRASTVERIATALSVPISELYKQPKHPVQYMEKNLKINTENIKSNEYCEPDCEYLSSRHNCKKYKRAWHTVNVPLAAHRLELHTRDAVNVRKTMS